MTQKMKANRLILAVEILLTICICIAIVMNVLANLQSEALRLATETKQDYQRLTESYLSVFKAMILPVKEKIAENLSFDEMNAWLQSQEENFREAVGADVYDGFAMTYRGGYAHSWAYGEYSDYDPDTRPWYQAAARAEGRAVVVAPYVTYLDPSYLEAGQSILLTVAQRFSDEISFDLDLRIADVNAMLARRNLGVYGETVALLYDANGYVLSTNEGSLYCHNVGVPDSAVSPDLSQKIAKAAESSNQLILASVDGVLRFLYAQRDPSGNTLCLLISFAEVFVRDFLTMGLLAIFLIVLEICSFCRNHRRLAELSERDARITEIADAAYQNQIYVDLGSMRCTRGKLDGETREDYAIVYAELLGRVGGEEARREFAAFLSPEALRNRQPGGLTRRSYNLQSFGSNGMRMWRLFEFGLIVSAVNERRTATILGNDVTEEVRRRKRALQSIAYHYEAAFVGNTATQRYEAIKTDGVFGTEESDGPEAAGMNATWIGGHLKEEYKELYFEATSFEGIARRLEKLNDYSVTVELTDGHWYTVKIIKCIGYEAHHEFILCAENVDEQMRRQEELRTALDKARVATQAKTNFLSRMSHDIRTPLNGIIGMTAIARGANKDSRVGESLDTIRSSSLFLLGLINDILDISKIESGQLVLNEQPVPLVEFDAVIDAVIRPLMDEKRIHFLYRMGCGMQCAKLDPVRFNQVFFNLLSNAAKYTPEGGEVEFSAEAMLQDKHVEWVRFIVRDTGVGMSAAFLAHSFEPFEQEYDANVRQQHQGTGLGLAIAKELVEKMGGRIRAESELGKGSTFTVELPLKKAKLPAPKPEARAVDMGALQGKTVLLVEDNRVNTIVATKLLEAKEVKVLHAADGAKAVEIFLGSARGEINLILMDVLMPVMDGVEATRAIRALPRSDAQAVPILALTANAFEEDVKRCLAAGMNEHLAKPLEPQKLYETMAKYFAKA